MYPLCRNLLWQYFSKGPFTSIINSQNGRWGRNTGMRKGWGERKRRYRQRARLGPLSSSDAHTKGNDKNSSQVGKECDWASNLARSDLLLNIGRRRGKGFKICPQWSYAALRCSGCGVQGNFVLRKGHWIARFVGDSRYSEGRRSRAIDYFEGVEWNQSVSISMFLRLRARPHYPTDSALLTQHGHCIYPKSDVICV